MKSASKIFKVLLGWLVLFLVLTPVGRAAAQTWIQLTPAGGPPAPRGAHGTTAVVDPASNRMIVFAGMSSSFGFPFNDAWVLTDANGVGGTPTWTQLFPTGAPLPRAGHSAVYDATNNRMTIFGGCHGGCFPILNDVWVLTNANGLGGTPTWIQLFPTGTAPSGRVRHTAVYDPATNRMIVFGGQNGSGFGGATFPEVWVLTNANGLGGSPAWTQLIPAGGPPPGQYAPSAVYDPVNNRMTVFGGASQGTGANTNAVWVLSNANGLGGPPTWTNLVAEGTIDSPPQRSFHSAVYDAASNRMTIFGGVNNDVWVLTGANGLGDAPTWEQLFPTGEPPAARCCHGAVYDAATNRMTIFGGNAGPLLNDTWVLTEAVGVTQIAVAIDIKPGSFPNSINLGSGGTVPVAILSTTTFDATMVDPTTVTLAGAPVQLKGKGTPMASVEDVNGDGLPDLVVHVSTEALQLSESDESAVLEGQTFDGTPIMGTDSVRIVP